MKPLTDRWLWLALAMALLGMLFAAGCDDDDDDDDDNDDSGDDDDDDDDDNDDDTGVSISPGFVRVAAGSFVMGSPADEPGAAADEQPHAVTLTHDFELQATEVTQTHFEALSGFAPSRFPSLGAEPYLPVEQVSWYDALAFANVMSAAAGYAPCFVLTNAVCTDDVPPPGEEATAGFSTVAACSEKGGIDHADVALVEGVENIYDCEGYRLPTEAEWEYAARAGTDTALYNGDVTHPSCTPLDEGLDAIAWYCGNAEKKTHPVATKEPNGWGLFDMLGNVLEWTWDGYAKATGGDAIDPVGAADAMYKSTRGGMYRWTGPPMTRSASRSANTPDYRHRTIGFRMARTLAATDVTPEALDVPAGASASMPPVADVSAGLPFDFEREDVGTPLTPEEISAFTAKITGFWKDVPFFEWVLWHSHGMAEDNPWDMPDYKVYWQDTGSIKSGDTVTFEHHGGADNLMIRTSKVLNGAAAGYLMSGDATLGRIVEQYAKGFVSQCQGMAFDADDPEDYLMARAVMGVDHEYTEDGRHAIVDYGPAKVYRFDWNAHTIPNDNNPYYGSVWLRTMRSKDDVPHIYRSVPLLKMVAQQGADQSVRDAAQAAVEHVTQFAKDIVDTGYFIRSKEYRGNAFIPLDENDLVADLASFVQYNDIATNAECDPKLGTALIAYGEPLDVNCANGIGGLYEAIAVAGHYFNWAIIRYFHIAAVTNALMVEQDTIAKNLLRGLATRADRYLDDEESPETINEWEPDVAGFLVASAAAGLPLTSEEARLVVEQHAISVDIYETFQKWDLWDDSIPDGEHGYKPSRHALDDTALRLPEMVFVLEYCQSPWKNETGAAFVDCDIVADPERWGEEPE